MKGALLMFNTIIAIYLISIHVFILIVGLKEYKKKNIETLKFYWHNISCANCNEKFSKEI